VIQTDDQRRWWFATHPEYSWRRRGITSRKHGERKHAPGTYLEYADQDQDEADRNAALDEEFRKAIELDKKGIEADPHTFLDLFPYRRLVTAPISFFQALLRSQAQHTILNAVKKAGDSGGPGKWVEVARSRIGIEHQSKMSGNPIEERDGKRYIKEYLRYGVYFDDYVNGKLYEYKGSYGKLINKFRLFYDWVRGVKTLPDQAKRQAAAARGIPVIWKVGKDQVKAFRKAVGNVPGIEIVP